MYGFQFEVTALKHGGILDKGEALKMTFLSCHLAGDETGIYTMEDWLENVQLKSQERNHDINYMIIFNTPEDYETYCEKNNQPLDFHHNSGQLN